MKSFLIYRFGKRNAFPRADGRPNAEEAPERTEANARAEQKPPIGESARAALLTDFFRRHESATKRASRK